MVPYLVLGGVTDDGVVPVPPDGAEGRALHYAGQPDLLGLGDGSPRQRWQLLHEGWLGGDHNIDRGSGTFTNLKYFSLKV